MRLLGHSIHHQAEMLTRITNCKSIPPTTHGLLPPMHILGGFQTHDCWCDCWKPTFLPCLPSQLPSRRPNVLAQQSCQQSHQHLLHKRPNNHDNNHASDLRYSHLIFVATASRIWLLKKLEPITNQWERQTNDDRAENGREKQDGGRDKCLENSS